MRTFVTLLSTCLVISLSAQDVTAQQKKAHPNNRIASTEMEAAPNEPPRFIEGISMGSISSTKIEEKSVKTDRNLADKRERQLSNFDEPEPTIRDKRTASETIKEGIAKNRSLYGFIKEWYGTPYRLGGTSKKAIDCSAFTRELLGQVYGSDLQRTAAMQYDMSKKIRSKSELKEGDLVFFSIKSKRITHVGVYLGEGKFVHASSSRGVMISELSQNYWTRYYAGGGRIEN